MAKKPTLYPGDSTEEAGLKLSISKDGLSANLTLARRFAPRWTTERILRFLHTHGVVHGAKPAALRAMFRDKRFNELVVAASGTPVNKGTAAKVKAFFRYPEVYRALRRCPDAESFAREAIGRLSITRETPIARQIPGTEGVDGKDVLGNILPARDPDEEQLIPGTGTLLSIDNLELLPERDGVVSYDGTTFRVLDVQVHEGDVLPGDSEEVAEGTLVIVGSVRSDAVVRAKGDVIVCGAVEAAEIGADGSVLIGGTVEGGKRGSIRAGGHILTRSTKYAHISAGHTVWVFGSAVQSTIRADRCIHMWGGNTRARGGTLQAELKIHTGEVGSKNEIATELVVAQQMSELADHLAAMQTELGTRDGQLEKARSLAIVLKELKAREGRLAPEKEETLITVVRTEWGLRGQADMLRHRVRDLEEQFRDLRRREHAIQCTGTVWPGTVIRMGRFSHRVDQPVSNSKFVLSDSKIEKEPLEENPDPAKYMDS